MESHVHDDNNHATTSRQFRPSNYVERCCGNNQLTSFHLKSSSLMMIRRLHQKRSKSEDVQSESPDWRLSRWIMWKAEQSLFTHPSALSGLTQESCLTADQTAIKKRIRPACLSKNQFLKSFSPSRPGFILNFNALLIRRTFVWKGLNLSRNLNLFPGRAGKNRISVCGLMKGSQRGKKLRRPFTQCMFTHLHTCNQRCGTERSQMKCPGSQQQTWTGKQLNLHERLERDVFILDVFIHCAAENEHERGKNFFRLPYKRILVNYP